MANTTNTSAGISYDTYDLNMAADRIKAVLTQAQTISQLESDVDNLITRIANVEENIDEFESDIDSKIPLTQKGATNGVATLDSTGKLSNKQLPPIPEIDSLHYYSDKNIIPTSQADFTWTVSDDAATVTGYTGSATEVVIPYQYVDGDNVYPVTIIGNGIFLNNSNIISVVIPYGITHIGNAVFHSCSNLTNVTIPNSVTDIGTSAFYGCTNLTSVIIPNSVTSAGTAVFRGCTSLTNITVPNSLTAVDTRMFYGCTNLTRITIPDSVISFGSSVFNGCENLTIICSQGSYAETYAKANNISYKYDVVEPEIYNTTAVQIGTWIDGTPVWRMIFQDRLIPYKENNPEYYTDFSYSPFIDYETLDEHGVVINTNNVSILNGVVLIRQNNDSYFWDTTQTNKVYFALPESATQKSEIVTDHVTLCMTGYIEFVTPNNNIVANN